MIIMCKTCCARFDDEFRSTICPHATFAANDGHNNFAHHPESHLEPMHKWISNAKPGTFRIIKGAVVGPPQMMQGVEGAYPVEKLVKLGLIGVYATHIDCEIYWILDVMEIV